ncbi:MAG: SprT family zinc-dependent metalloprotease [Cyanobacteria bacterium J06623_7]
MKVGSLEIELVRKNIKNLYIRVYPPDGRIRVVCPQKLEETQIRQFIAAKIRWIEQKQTKFRLQPPTSPRRYVTGESCYFKGDRFILEVIYHHAPPRVEIDASTINLYVRYGSIEEQRERVLTEWYRQQLKAELPSIIAKWEGVIGVKTNDWGVKKMKTRWGTCNTRAKRIWLNLELIKKPTHCLEYVVVHELVHLLERQHNARFWHYVSLFMPEWQQYRAELQQRTYI